MDNYRPISLLTSIPKFLGKVESNQVSEYLIKIGYSTMDNMGSETITPPNLQI